MTDTVSTGDRFKAAVIAIVIEGALGYMLVSALGYHVPRLPEPELKLFGVMPPPPPPPPDPVAKPRPPRRRPQAAAAPPNLRAKATPVVVPTPIVPSLAPPPPVVVAPIAENGLASSAGAADTRGPGIGAGSEGNGFGGGGRGDGDGGGGLERETPPRQIGGKMGNRDLPQELADLGPRTVWVRFTVGIDGRVSRCRVTESSGVSDLDALTCRLIEQRWRYRPSLDADHRPVEAMIVESHGWTLGYDDRR